MFLESSVTASNDLDIAAFTFEERKKAGILSCRLAIAEKDLLRARTAGNMNAVERALFDVNRLRARSGLPGEPELPPHVHHPSLRLRIGWLPNGTALYRHGFGLEVGQRVVWQSTPRHPSRAGTVEQIFEYGRNPTVVFRPDEGVAFWSSPHKLEPASMVDAFDALNTTSPAPPDPGKGLNAAPAKEAALPLLFMPCSGMKLSRAAPAGDLYTGVMWQSLRARGPVPVRMAIISAKHGVVLPDQLVEPYEQRMDEVRALELRRQTARQAAIVAPLLRGAPAATVFIAGGKLYRSVALDLVANLQQEGLIDSGAVVQCTRGGIGMQRAQLGVFLRQIVS